MADTSTTINSGFYDAVDGDRVYTADNMNEVYKNLLSNGIFSTPTGDVSTDFEVSASSGMDITVAQGRGIAAGHWISNPDILTITVPNNTSSLPRIDSVVLRLDARVSGREASVIYRTGEPASSPTRPLIITQTADLYEFRIADVYVASNAPSITSANITDRRGESQCPWVNAMVQQYQSIITTAEINDIINSIS